MSGEKALDSFGGSRWANGAKNGFTRCAVIFTTSENMYNLDQFSKHPCFQSIKFEGFFDPCLTFASDDAEPPM